MFQHQPFTQAELDADPRLAAPLDDKRQLLAGMDAIVQDPVPSMAQSLVEALVRGQAQVERLRERRHYAAAQADNVRRGWKPATLREILGEPQYAPTHDASCPENL